MKYKSKKREIVIDYMRSVAESSYSLAHISEVCEPHGVGKSTVYRIISELVNEGLVRKITDAKTQAAVLKAAVLINAEKGKQ